MTQGNNWLDENFTGYNAVHGAGVPVPQRKVLNFGAGLTVGDDPTTGVTTVTGTGSAPLYVSALVTTPPLNPSVQEFYIASAYSTPGDGGGGTFVWNPTDTRSADGGTIIAVTGIATGRWNRVYDGIKTNPAWFGGSTAALAAISARSAAAAVAPPAFSAHGSQRLVADPTSGLAKTQNAALFASLFCPLPLRQHYAACAGNAALPYLLSAAFASAGAAEAAFPLSTAAGDLTGGTYATNSLDWACINEAIRFSEANGNMTVWLDHPGSLTAFGVIGTFTIKGGVRVRGQGSMGSSGELGTPVVFFNTSADGFQWIGTSDPGGGGNYSAGTGGGMSDVTVIKAQRIPFGGSAYTGGKGIFLQAQSASQRPGVMDFHNVYVVSEVYGGGSNWSESLVIDGSAVTTVGGPGVRDLTFTGCRFNSSTLHNIHITYGEHITFNGLLADTGSGSSPNILLEGDCEDVHFAPLLAYIDQLTIQDANVVNVSNVSQANPAIVTTSTPHGYTTASGTAGVQIAGVVGGVGVLKVNGFNGTATILSPTTFSIPVDTTGGTAYASAGTVRSASPTDITVVGRLGNVTCTSVSAIGFVQPSTGYSSSSATWSATGQPSPIVGRLNYQSASPWLKFDGPGKPGFQCEVYGSAIANVTGDGTLYTVVWTNLNFDYNDEFHATPPFSGYTVAVAGTYRMRARVLLQNVTSSGVTSVQMYMLVTSSGSRKYKVQTGPAADRSGFQSLHVEETMQLSQGDVVTVVVECVGGTKTVGVFADSGSGFSMFSGELL